MRLTRRFVLRTAFALLCISVALLLLVPWIGMASHMFRGSTVGFSGATFSVPIRYWAQTSEKGPATMWRGDFGIPLWRAAYGFIGIYPHDRRIDKSRDFERLQKILVSEGASSGMSLVAIRELQTQLGDAFCFQFKSQRSSTVSCFFDGGTLGVEYEGSERYVGDVYEVVLSANGTQMGARNR